MADKEYQITCINKSDRRSNHEHITHIGNAFGNSRLTREDAIRRIEAGVEVFYTIDAATLKKAVVAVVYEQGKNPYLRTHVDGVWNDNLLALPECSGDCTLVR